MGPRMRRRITTAKREEIEKEQKLLENTIVRPFEILDDLPISYNAPPYGHYEDILKNPLTIKDSAVLYNSLIRSRNTYVFHAPMFKLHWVKQTAYAKKLAEMDKEKQKEILSDRENKRRFAKATTNSLEARTRIPVLSADVNARDVMSKLCESSITLGPHNMEVRIFIAKDSRSDKSKALSELSKVSGVSAIPGSSGMSPEATSAPPVKTEENPQPTPEPVTESTPEKTPQEKKPETETKEAEKVPTGKAKGAEKKAPQKRGRGRAKGSSTAAEKGKKANEKKEPEQSPPAAAEAPAPAPQPTQARPSPSNLQSIDNTIMISNLNAIAKIDLSLNDLMKEVASGKASEPQITTFKKYIERAKQMGPQPHHAELYFSRGLPLPANFPRPYQASPLLERKMLPRPKLYNPMKLTAFQERYLHNATLVFEFLENPNVRYIIPQDSISEVLEPKYPPPPDTEDGSDFKDVLISHLWIHNIDEVEQYEKQKAEYEAEMKRKAEEEEAKRKKEAGEEDGSEQTPASEPVPSEPRNLRTKKKAPPPKKKKQLTAPEPPHIKFTTFSFTVHNVPTRFVPIFQNSMKPLKQVQNHMEHILKTGTRISSFYLWYQLDARLDEQLAEDLRNKAAEEEADMTGYMPPVEPKKRKPRDYRAYRLKKLKQAAEAEALAAANPNAQPQPEPKGIISPPAPLLQGQDTPPAGNGDVAMEEATTA